MFVALLAASSAFAPASIRPAVQRVAPIAAPIAAPLARTAPPAMIFGPAAAIAPTLIQSLEGPALVSAAWVLMALNFMPLGPTAAGMSPAHYKWGDRSFMNMIEQAPLFLISMWMFSVFVSATIGTQLGFVYLGLRFLYPVIWCAASSPQSHLSSASLHRLVVSSGDARADPLPRTQGAGRR